jgi:hypothetical protein
MNGLRPAAIAGLPTPRGLFAHDPDRCGICQVAAAQKAARDKRFPAGEPKRPAFLDGCFEKPLGAHRF